MEQYKVDARTGLKYELVGDYYLLAGEEPPELPSLGSWGRQRRSFLWEHRKPYYFSLLINGALNSHLQDVDTHAEQLFFGLVEQLAEQEGISEHLKAADPLAWVGAMNNLRARATEIVQDMMIFT